MCNPAVIAVASAVISAAGQMQAARAQQATANANARAAEEAAAFRADREADRARRQLAAARVTVAKAGVDASGSPLDVLADAATEAELDRLAILRQGENARALSRYDGELAVQGGYLRSASALLRGTSGSVP